MKRHADAWASAQRRRWLRGDAERFMTPAEVAEERRLAAERRAQQDREGAAYVAQRYAGAEPLPRRRLRDHQVVQRIRCDLAALRFKCALLRWSLKYNPDQPRVPAGNPDGGQWTNGEGGGESGRIRLAGELPDQLPKLPEERPSRPQDRTKAVREVVRWMSRYGGPLAKVARGAAWLYEYEASILADLDPPRSLQDLYDAVDIGRAGTDIHHIVEQSSAYQDGFQRDAIESRDNLIRIPRLKHQQISAWFQKRDAEFDGLSPREFLRFRTWEERRRLGLRALIQFGVLRQ